MALDPININLTSSSPQQIVLNIILEKNIYRNVYCINIQSQKCIFTYVTSVPRPILLLLRLQNQWANYTGFYRRAKNGWRSMPCFKNEQKPLASSGALVPRKLTCYLNANSPYETTMWGNRWNYTEFGEFLPIFFLSSVLEYYFIIII